MFSKRKDNVEHLRVADIPPTQPSPEAFVDVNEVVEEQRIEETITIPGEIYAMARIRSILEKFDGPTKARILNWVVGHFDSKPEQE